MKIAIIVTCFNRKESTVKCLTRIKRLFENEHIDYDLHLTDDGCTDGTSDAVLSIIPNAYIYKGENLFWAGGMRLAWNGAYKKGGYDYYLFLNDDTYVKDNLVSDFLECDNMYNGTAIISGAICDPKTKKRTYVGFVIDALFPFKTHMADIAGKPQEIAYSGANIMFIPKTIVNKVGLFPSIYVHGIADVDYCCRARKKGFKVVMTSNYVGECFMNDGMTKIDLSKRSFSERYKYLFSPKGKAAKQWLFYQWSFYPWRVPFVFFKIVLQLLFGIKE